jgi:hypothetical protein
VPKESRFSLLATEINVLNQHIGGDYGIASIMLPDNSRVIANPFR